MKISNSYIQTRPTFQRKLREDEKPQFSKTMNEAFDYLGVNTRALIIHGSSFPNEIKQTKDLDKEYQKGTIENKNPYIGSPYYNQEFNLDRMANLIKQIILHIHHLFLLKMNCLWIMAS